MMKGVRSMWRRLFPPKIRPLPEMPRKPRDALRALRDECEALTSEIHARCEEKRRERTGEVRV